MRALERFSSQPLTFSVFNSDCAPAYFEYLSKAFFHGLPTVLCKIVGVYQIGVHNRETVSVRDAVVRD
jgi:hypothetical protein